ncbi:MAG: hypothetical protein LQ337_005158 [Flavoplaca oasis]|nr:MAG: hypothetical protein LQ337_005158 [Flavoplaca oasis]
MSFAQPVVKDNFVYNGDLFVDVGNLNRHKRASVAELTEVLRPDLKKPKNGAAVKDPVGHWYEAQLIHYGLPPSKDKARAKMRLLENLNQSKLSVPPQIIAIETALKKEYAAAERKAKAQYKASLAATPSTQKESASNKKRKVADNQNSFPTVNVNASVGDALSPNSSSSAPPKKRKLQTAKRGGSTSVPPAELSHAALQQNTTAAEATKPRPKQTARRSGSSLLSFRAKIASSNVESTTSAPHANSPFEAANYKGSTQKNPKPKKEPKPAFKKEAKVKQERPVKKEPKVKAESTPDAKTIGGSSRSAPASLGLINGLYEVSCPVIEREWDDDGFTIVLTLDSQSIWGEYDFGMFSGILRIPQRPFIASGDMLPFEWRGRENSEGEMSFGGNCVGGISFLGNGYIEGWINLYGECRFEGTRIDGPGTAMSSAADLRDQWDSYNEDEYERERVGRWH